MAKKKKTSWKDKRCPKCGSPVDMLETCRRCGRAWTQELEKDDTGHIIEEAVGLEAGQQHESIAKKVGPRKLRKSRFARTKEELAGKKSKAFSEDLPPQFAAWEIKESDDGAEIDRKRSLMRLDSRRIYNQMGLSVRAQESSKAVLLWLNRLWGFLELEEQDALAPTLKRLMDAFGVLTKVRRSKIIQAAKMEKAMEKAYQQARKARVLAAEKQKKYASKFPPPESDSEGLGLMPVGLESELLERAKEKLLKLEKEKNATKSKGRKKPEDQDDNPPDSEQ